MKRLVAFLVLVLSSIKAFAQEAVAADKPQMADAFRADGKIYVVVLVLSLVFVGLATYLVIIDRKVAKLEKQLNDKKSI